ncbi:MAG: AraC family transcriptional regulator [Caulobacteraceae bacterium]|nr:AraC family transcriptional regulator [Caulobacteraceae bacterium]
MAGSSFRSGQFLGARSTGVSVSGFQIDLRIATLPPEQVNSHAHDDAHFVLALDGGYRSLAHDPATPVDQAFGPGALVWNPAGVEHRDCFDAAGGRFLSVSFDPPTEARRGEPRRLRGRAEGAARRLVGATARFQPGDALILEGLALEMAAGAFSASDLTEDPAPDWVLRAREVIGDLATRPGLEVRDVAAAVGVHPVVLARRYRRHFGQTPGAAIRQMRTDRASGLVGRGGDLAGVAAEAGYADQSHMTREFLTLYGLTPGQYRTAFG